jgi:hypothetical protein
MTNYIIERDYNLMFSDKLDIKYCSKYDNLSKIWCLLRSYIYAIINETQIIKILKDIKYLKTNDKLIKLYINSNYFIFKKLKKELIQELIINLNIDEQYSKYKEMNKANEIYEFNNYISDDVTEYFNFFPK